MKNQLGIFLFQLAHFLFDFISLGDGGEHFFVRQVEFGLITPTTTSANTADGWYVLGFNRDDIFGPITLFGSSTVLFEIPSFGRLNFALLLFLLLFVG